MQNTERTLKTQQLENKQPNKNGQKYSNTHFTKEDMYMKNKHRTRCHHLLMSSRGWGNNMKTAVRYHVYLSE